MKTLRYFLVVLVILLGLVSSASAGEKASNPNPSDGATCVEPDTYLSWSPGDHAASHNVYFGSSFADVNAGTGGTFKGRQASTTYEPGVLDVPCKTYYWRIDEVNDLHPDKLWKGDVWSFTTKGDDCCCIDPPEGMVAWWPFDEEPGTTIANDFAGSINDQGALLNGASFISNGMVDGGLELDGEDDYVSVPDSPELNFGTGNLSIDAWIKTSKKNGVIIDKRKDSPLKGYVLSLLDGKPCFQLADGIGVNEWTNYLSSLTVALNEWQHVAVTVDRDNPNGLVFYVDCVSQTLNPTDRTGDLNNEANVWLGNNHFETSNNFSGDIDEVELFNRALDANEICAIFEAGSAGKCKCQCGEWNDVEVTWMVSCPDTTNQWTGSCGESVEINSTEGEAITATSSIACTPESCDPSYSWDVTGPGGFSDSSNQLPAEFIPPQDGTYEVVLHASCDGRECLTSCTITMNIKFIRPAPDYPDDIKWSQPPVKNNKGCFNGWDEVSSYNTKPIIADDWLCKDDRPIKDIHWWGSFKGWKEHKLPPDAPAAFHIGIWTDVPDPEPNKPNTFSHPRKLIWENICECYVWSFAGYDLDPRGEGENDACFKFDQLLSEDKWFYQKSNEPNGTVYWLSIAAIYYGNTPENPWGWKTRPHFYNDDAVRILPPVAFCPNDCPNPNYSEFVGGVNDNYNTNNFEPATPSLALAALLTNPADFDEVNSNHQFGHTITNLPPCIVRAELEIVLRSRSGDACNDGIALQVTGGAPAFVWSRRIGAPSSSPDYCQGPAGLLSYTWFSGKTVTFNLVLSNLPNLGGGVPTDLLPLLNSDGHLDVYIQDDTAVDYMILRVWSCPLVTGQWPPKVGSFWENGGPIEYPKGISWDMAFALTSNREYPEGVRKSADINGDGKVDLKDFAIFAAQYLDP